MQERNSLSEEIARQKKAYEQLEQRICKRAAVDADIPAEVVRRLNRLENQVEHYRVENTTLRDNLKATQGEAVELHDQIAGQENKLKAERTGEPHLRVTDPASDFAVAVIPVELSVDWAHFKQLFAVLKSNQTTLADHLQQWYTDWKKPKVPTRQVVGANYVDEKRDKGDVNLNKLYADMVDLTVNGHVPTGAEHDGSRSTRSLQTICCNAEERHNGGN